MPPDPTVPVPASTRGDEPAWVAGLLACRFATRRASERDGEDRVSVRVPRFDGGVLRRLLMPLLPRPDFRIRLDALGSAAWDLCDGTRSGEDIARRLAERFPDQPDVRLRLAMFLQALVRQGHLGAEREA